MKDDFGGCGYIPELDNDSSYELYPFDAGRCERCVNGRFDDGDTICVIYDKSCSSIRGCNNFIREHPNEEK